MRPPHILASCPDYASLVHLIARSDLLGVLPHPALLGHGAPGEVVPLALREAMPRYAMHLFTSRRPRRAVALLAEVLQQQFNELPPPR